MLRDDCPGYQYIMSQIGCQRECAFAGTRACSRVIEPRTWLRSQRHGSSDSKRPGRKCTPVIIPARQAFLALGLQRRPGNSSLIRGIPSRETVWQANMLASCGNERTAWRVGLGGLMPQSSPYRTFRPTGLQTALCQTLLPRLREWNGSRIDGTRQ
jgi:hypothetical protein